MSAADVIALLESLVAIDSVNPSLVPGAAGEGEVVRFIDGWARAAGLDATVVEPVAGRPSIVVRGGTAGTGRTLLLCAHVDTVGVGRMSDPFRPRTDGDRLYGRGAYDMKAGLAASLVACRDATSAGGPGQVVVAAVADEEHSSIGVQQVLAEVHADAAVVTEPTELVVATAHKGFLWSQIDVTGQAAHGSRPHLGVDAIVKTGPVLVALEQLDRELAGREHPLLGRASVHASLISGGLEESTIPDSCTLTVERRTLPGETAADVEAELAGLLEQCRRRDPQLVVSSRTTLARDAFEIAAEHPFVVALRESAGAVLGRPATGGGVSYWADSAFLAAAGIPTVLFGPGGDGAHAEVEWVSLQDTVACAETLTALARAFIPA